MKIQKYRNNCVYEKTLAVITVQCILLLHLFNSSPTRVIPL